MTEQRSLSVYLNDHLAAATGGVELFRRATASRTGPLGADLAQLRDEAVADRDSLKSLLTRLEVRENVPLTALGWLGEKVGRLKPNGYVVRRSPLADVIELEALRLVTYGKLSCWQVLLDVAAHDDRVPAAELTRLVARAEKQLARLEALHLRTARDRLAG
jgi:hypothetical protein